MFEREREAGNAVAKIMREDLLLRNTVLSCVAEAMRDFGRIDPERADSDAHDLATHAVALAVARVTSENGLLVAMTQERDHYKKIASTLIGVMPLRKLTPTEATSFNSRDV